MKILLVNPPIYDFAAYDFWMKPLGLLYLSSLLKKEGHRVYLLDATNRYDSSFGKVKSDTFGRGKINYIKVRKPEVLKEIPGRFKRYGLPEKVVRKRIKEIKPEAVMLTCSMTYWYLGLLEIKRIIESLDYDPVLLLGGIYSTLLPEHAKKLGFKRIYSRGDNYIEKIGFKMPESFSRFPPPDYSHYSNLSYACLTTSIGCPFRCPYCASSFLYDNKDDKEIEQVVDEIYYLYKKGVRKFAFYDDALLVTPRRFIRLCKEIKERKISAFFFTPNGLHSRFISREVARMMFEVGFKEPRISLETSDEELQKELSMKTSNYEFVKAVDNLTEAGYRKKNIYTYLLAGVPGMTYRSVEQSILFVARAGVKISLAEFSPIPGTKMEEELSDPLLTNNTVYYHYKGKAKEMEKVKELAGGLNHSLD